MVTKPMIHLLPHWNWKKGETVRVAAPSNCEEAELFLNGKSLGRKACDLVNTAEWQVEFAPGRLLVKGYKNGKCVAKAEQRTAGKPYGIKLIPEMQSIKNDGADTAVVNIAIVDKRGIVCPTADNLVKFEIVGDGYIRGVGNGDPNSHESDVLPERHAYCGLCQALVTSDLDAKSIKLIATSEGLESAECDFTVEAVEQPVCPETARITVLDKFTMSKVYDLDDKPDPNMYISDDDMNSFTPVAFVHGALQKDFTGGYRIYRMKTKVTSRTADYFIKFVWGHWDGVFVYINGKCVLDLPWRHAGEYKTGKFALCEGEEIDIRILVHALPEHSKSGAGFADAITLEEA